MCLLKSLAGLIEDVLEAIVFHPWADDAADEMWRACTRPQK